MNRNQIAFAVLCFFAALCLVVIAPSIASAQQANMCGEHSKFIKVFKEKYNETGVALGISGETNLVELYTSPNGETWTLIAAQANGMACIIAAGKDWMAKAAVIDGKDS